MHKNAVYKGSISWSWNDTSATSSTSVGPNTFLRFNAVKLEAVSCFDLTTGFPSNPLPSPLFVSIDEISPIAFEFVTGKQIKPIGGAQWGGGGYLIINESLSPLKMTTSGLDFLRGQLTFTIYGADGLPIVTPAATYKAVTVSFWEVCTPTSSTS